MYTFVVFLSIHSFLYFICFHLGCIACSLIPRPPFNTPRGKGGLVNIVQHFCTSAGISAVQSDWLMWQLSHLYLASLPQTLTHVYLYCTV